MEFQEIHDSEFHLFMATATFTDIMRVPLRILNKFPVRPHEIPKSKRIFQSVDDCRAVLSDSEQMSC